MAFSSQIKTVGWDWLLCLIILKLSLQAVDAHNKNRYDENASGWPDGRGPALRREVEESPHSTEHGAGETRGGETCRIGPQKQTARKGEGEKAV
jgi:hypothetical protein